MLFRDMRYRVLRGVVPTLTGGSGSARTGCASGCIAVYRHHTHDHDHDGDDDDDDHHVAER